jgi:hypothetical protein
LIAFLHPRRSSLVAFATGDAFTGRSRVAKHLGRCAECRRFVGFTQRLEKVASALPAPTPADDLLGRALAARTAGERVILPAKLEPQHPARFPARTAAVVVAAAILALWWTTRAPRAEFTSANELLLAGIVPRSAEAGQGGRADRTLSHKLRPMTATYLRRFIDGAGGIVGAGRFELRVEPTGPSAWLLTSMWRDVDARIDSSGSRVWAESLTVADSTLAPAARIVHLKPYRKWAGIYINQRFRNDSVVGQMSLDDDPTRRPIAANLAAVRGRLIGSDALAPMYFMGVPLLPGSQFDLSALGWAVRPDDALHPMRMKVTGSERIETPVGTFDCWKFEITVGKETHYHWVRKADHLGVRTVRRMPDGRTRELILVSESASR